MYKYKIGVISSDFGGCFYYRIQQPFQDLKAFGIDYNYTVFLPQKVGEDQDHTLVRWVEQFDIILVQRCFKYDIFKRLKRACEIAGRSIIFESDDDYINLPQYNPCFKEMQSEGAIDGFKQILREADSISVTTQELRDVYYPYNQNIKVIPNNIRNVSLFKDEYVQEIGEDGRVPFHEVFGFVSYPSFAAVNVPGKGKHIEKLFKIGYTATPTHRMDYLTIKPHLEKFLKKYPNTIMWYIGDPWFKENHPVDHKNVIFVPNSQYDLYMQNIRNFDVGIAPLVPDIFNMSKSPLKLLEYASWGIPAVAPNYVTYNREFKDGETAMLYNNGKEFYEKLEILMQDHQLRHRMGLNAAIHVDQTRTERVNAKERAEYYIDLIEKTPKSLRFRPNKKVTQNETTT